MLILYNSSEIVFESLVPGSCSIKDSFSSNPAFDQTKEAISQITLAMDKI